MQDAAREVRKNLKATFSYRLLPMDTPVLTDQQTLTFITSAQGDLTWLKGVDDEKKSRESVTSLRLNDDDDDAMSGNKNEPD